MNCRYCTFIFILFTGLIPEVSGQAIYKTRLITSRANDDVVTAYTENGILYSSNKSVTSFLAYTDAEKNKFFNIWELKIDEEGNPGASRLFAPELKTLQNDGPASLDAQGSLMVFTRNFTTRRFGNIHRANPFYGLFFADRVNEVFSNIREFEHNVRNARTTHPSLSADGKTLYFASDREGGFGGFDLYVSRYINGRWTEPENLGPAVNTPDNEVYPYLHPSGRLYFSSDGHIKAGGYDIYYAEIYENVWTPPVKLPSPFNSPLNDFTIILDDKFEKGFVTSARRGSLDIYMIESVLPSFDVCKQQKADNFCFVFFERNTMEIDTSLYRYVWDLGDETKIEAVEAEHCYKGPGNYIISLDVVDVLTKEIMFNQAEYELELKKTIQAFITCPDTVSVRKEFQLNGFDSHIGEAIPGEYYWNFGDGGKAIGVNVKHAYMVPGVYNIKLGIAEEAVRNEVPGKYCSYKTIVVTDQ